MKPNAPPGLTRVLGPWTATAIVVGTVIGTGVFKKPQSVAEHVSHFGIVAVVWTLGGVMAILGALAYGEVAALLPRAGGNYVFLREAYGKLAGFLWGWVDFWIIRSASMAALATIFTESLHSILADPAAQQLLGLPPDTRLSFWGQRAVTVGVLAALAGINAVGVRWGGGVQLAVTIIKVASLVAIGALPFLTAMAGGLRPRPDLLQPTWPSSVAQLSFAGATTAFLGVLWAYHGWMNVTPVAGEVKNPQRNLPLALLVGVGMVTLLYLGANLAYSLVLPRPEMAMMKDKVVATEFSRTLLGPLGAAAVSAAILCSTFGALNGNLLVGPRMLYAMGVDRLAPPVLSAVHPRFHTPARAIFVYAAWSIALILGVAALTESGLLEPGKSHFDRLTDFAMFGAVIFETLAVVSIFVFRRTRPDDERRYRCPGYPVVPALYVVFPACVLVNMFLSQTFEAFAGLAFIGLGAALYWAADLKNSSQPPPEAWAVPSASEGIRLAGALTDRLGKGRTSRPGERES
jgi:amino acid transporter